MDPFVEAKAHMAELRERGLSESELREAYARYNLEHHALAEAVHDGAVAQVRRLLASGESPNATDVLGSPALHIAAASGDLALISLLLDAGADINSRDCLEMTALIQAANCCESAAVEMLLFRGANPTLTSDAGYSAADRVLYSEDALLRLLQDAEIRWPLSS